MAFPYDIGLVGYWNDPNYGAALTQYALYCLLRDKGKRTLLISTPLDAPWVVYQNEDARYRHLPYRPDEISSHQASIRQMRRLNDECAMFLLGSDQMLGYEMYEGTGRFANLSWAGDYKKKAAFAASFGKDVYDGGEKSRARLAYYLQKFDVFTVREAQGVALAWEAFGVEATEVLDPVFLCPRQHFDALAEKGTSYAKSRVLAYMLDPNGDKQKLTESVAETLGKPLAYFPDAEVRDHFWQPWADQCPETTYTEDWLRAFAECDFVVTDSFHGTCFSILYQKPFLAICNPKRGAARFTSLLEKLGLGSRLVYTGDGGEGLPPGGKLPAPIDYAAVADRINAEKDRSMAWLNKAIAPLEKPRAMSSHDIFMDTLYNPSLTQMKDMAEVSEPFYWLREKPLVVWGAGDDGHATLGVLQMLGIPVSQVVDTGLAGSEIVVNGIAYSVGRPEVLAARQGQADVHILVAVSNCEPIFSILEEWGYRKQADCRWAKPLIEKRSAVD